MNINGIEVRRNDVGDWEFLSESPVMHEPDSWHSVCDVLGAFGGSGVEQLFDLLEQSAEALASIQKLVEMLMPGVAKIAIQDYQLLNEAPIAAARALKDMGLA